MHKAIADMRVTLKTSSSTRLKDHCNQGSRSRICRLYSAQCQWTFRVMSPVCHRNPTGSVKGFRTSDDAQFGAWLRGATLPGKRTAKMDFHDFVSMDPRWFEACRLFHLR